MAISLVASATKNAAIISSGTTSAVDTTGGSGIIVIMGAGASAGTLSVSDNKSNTYTAINNVVSGWQLSMFYCAAPTVGTGHTFSPGATTPASYNGTITVFCFSGTDRIVFYDGQQNSNFSLASTTVQPGSITPSRNGCLIVSGHSGATNGSVPTINLSFSTPFGTAAVAGTSFSAYGSYLIQTAAAAINPTWTDTSGTNLAAIASFRANSIFVPQVGAFIVGI